MDLFFNIQKRKREEPPDISFKKLFLEYYKPLLAYTITLTGERESAEDIIQDVFLQVWIRKKEIDFIYIKAYLYKSVYNKFLTYQRDKKLLPDSDKADSIEKYFQQHIPSDPSEELHYKDILQEINRYIETLPVKGKDIFRMSRDEKIPHKKIAEELNISEKAVEKHITKILKGLRVALREAGFLFYFL